MISVCYLALRKYWEQAQGLLDKEECMRASQSFQDVSSVSDFHGKKSCGETITLTTVKGKNMNKNSSIVATYPSHTAAETAIPKAKHKREL